jgi:hypothetical protein
MRWEVMKRIWGEQKHIERVLAETCGIRPLGKQRCRWEENPKNNLQEVEYGDMDWIQLAQNRRRWCVFVNAIMNFRVP